MVGRTSVLTWEVPVDQEEPWRRFLQELSGARHGEYTESRRRLGITAESIWLAPRRSGGGTAVVYLETEDPGWALDRALRELAASDDPFDSWYRTQMRELFGCDFARSPRVPGGELLFDWQEAPDEAEQAFPEDS
jgi:hypothetical protein